MQVIPITDGKRMLFSEKLNKIFCDKGTFEFRFKLDFDKVPSYEQPMMVRTVLAFTDPALQNIPLRKCLTCVKTYQALCKILISWGGGGGF
jgi:hypothetical protein